MPVNGTDSGHSGTSAENRRPSDFRSRSAVFHCRRCGRCCRWHGIVRMADPEIAAAAAWLGVAETEFIERYMALTPDRRGLTLAEGADGTCVMLTVAEDGLPACRIEGAKPRQCRAFPEKWNFPGWEKECAGAEEWQRQTEEKTR